jgi:hypothetical protein
MGMEKAQDKLKEKFSFLVLFKVFINCLGRLMII